MEKGHKKEFKEAIDLLKKRGFVVSLNGLNYEQSVLYQYDFDNLRFQKTTKQHLMDLWNKIYINSYGRDYSFIEIILSLPNASNSKLNNHQEHTSLLQRRFDLNRLNELTNQLLDSNNARKEDIPVIEYKSVQQLLQHLINNDVFFDGKFYQYTGNRFAYVGNISRLFSKQNLEYFSSAMINNRLGLFARHLTNANGIIADWIDYDFQQRRLSETKSDYDEIQYLIDSFE